MGAGNPDRDELGELALQSTVASGVVTAIASGVLAASVGGAVPLAQSPTHLPHSRIQVLAS